MRDWCSRSLQFQSAVISFCFPMNVGLTLAMPRDARAYRHRGERFADVCAIMRDLFGGGSVLVWSGIMGDNKTRLINRNVNAQTYRNDVAVEALPFILFHGQNVTFMHDNARPHSAATTRLFLATNNVNVLV